MNNILLHMLLFYFRISCKEKQLAIKVISDLSLSSYSVVVTSSDLSLSNYSVVVASSAVAHSLLMHGS